MASSGVKQDTDGFSPVIDTTYTNYNTENTGGLTGDVMRFTVPINGIYVVMASSIATPGGGAAPLVLFHNDQATMVTSHSDGDDMSAPEVTSNQVILTLNVGDVVELKVPGTGSFSGSMFMDSCEVTFSGYLDKIL